MLHSMIFEALIAIFRVSIFQGTSEINCRGSCGAREKTSPYKPPLIFHLSSDAC